MHVDAPSIYDHIKIIHLRFQISTHLEKEQLLLGAPEERVFERLGGAGPRRRLGADHLLNQILCYDVIWLHGETVFTSLSAAFF